MKDVIKKNSKFFPVSYLFTQVNKYERIQEKENEEVVIYVKSDFYQTDKYLPFPFYKPIDY